MDQQARYAVGGDVMLVGTGQRTNPAVATSFTGAGKIGLLDTGDSDAAGISAEALKKNEDDGPRYLFIPISDYLKVNGVQAATRVGHYPATLRFSTGGGLGGDAEGHILGVDWADYGRIAYWRSDFAAQPLGALMNALAGAPDGVLVPEKVLADQSLRIGDNLPVNVRLPEGDVELTLRIVGSFKLWPSWYPNKKDEGPLVVANLDHIFEDAGGQSQYDVWIKVTRGADAAAVVKATRQIDKGTWDVHAVQSLVEREQTRPERQGLFGMLSIGFCAAAVLTVLGFFLYAVFSFRRRFIELGVLRAIGLSAPQMALSLSWEMVLLLGIGMAAGTLLGLWASKLYIPFLQVNATNEARTLPFIVITDWSAVYGVYLLFAALFIVAVGALVAFLSRINLFQAVKLGETE
jgi:putative ABC transport system permease protein